jgi:ribokinase
MLNPVLVVGSINLDLVASAPRIPAPSETLTGTSFQTFFGGKGANQAVGVARLGYPVNMIAKVGDDDIGQRLLGGLKAAGVKTRAIGAARKTSSGVAIIATDSAGQNSIIVIPGANGKLTTSDLRRHAHLIASAGIILVQLETPLDTVATLVQMARRNSVPVMLDPAPARELPPDLLRDVTWLTPNETEAAFLGGGSASAELSELGAQDVAEKLLALGPKNVIIKMGSRGAFLATCDGTREQFPAFKVQAVDSTAAGDAFNGSFAVGLMQEKPLGDALRFASAAAAISVTRKGAQPSMPTAKEVAAFLRRANAST